MLQRVRVPRITARSANAGTIAMLSLAAGLTAGIAPAMPPSVAQAADWPLVKADARNPVPTCATPGRLMALVRSRNPAIDARFETIAAEYKRHGEALGMRWDFAFYQMLAETADLSFRKGIRGGHLKAEQNNFAGLGSVSAAEPGESFPDIATGARAHLEHVLHYAGHRVEAPVAERTRKVQEWGTLAEFHKSLKGPASYADVLGKWAPKAKAYTDAILATADAFMAEHCRRPDPTEGVAAVPRGSNPAVALKAEAQKPEPAKAETADPLAKPSGADLARKAITDAKAEGNVTRSALGAGLANARITPPVKILNAPDEKPSAQATFPQAPVQQAPIQQAAAAPAAAAPAAAAAQAAVALPPAAAQKCRVWTASYGGEKALIIRSVTGETTNFTVLDVNTGQETREADAYIAAYAKGGKVDSQYATQAQALDRAFELCPEG